MIKLICSLSIAVIIFISPAFAQVCTINAGAIATSSQKSFCSGDGIANVVTVTVTGALEITIEYFMLTQMELSRSFSREAHLTLKDGLLQLLTHRE